MQLYCRQVSSLFAAAFLKAQLVITPHQIICIYLNYFNFVKMILQLSIICFPPNQFFIHARGLLIHYYYYLLMCSTEVLFYCSVAKL